MKANNLCTASTNTCMQEYKPSSFIFKTQCNREKGADSFMNEPCQSYFSDLSPLWAWGWKRGALFAANLALSKCQSLQMEGGSAATDERHWDGQISDEWGSVRFYTSSHWWDSLHNTQRNTNNHKIPRFSLLSFTNTPPASLAYWYMLQTSQCSQRGRLSLGVDVWEVGEVEDGLKSCSQ